MHHFPSSSRYIKPTLAILWYIVYSVVSTRTIARSAVIMPKIFRKFPCVVHGADVPASLFQDFPRGTYFESYWGQCRMVANRKERTGFALVPGFEHPANYIDGDRFPSMIWSMIATMSDLMSVDDAAKYLGVSAIRVNQFCNEGRIGEKVGNTWIIRKKQLVEFAKKRRAPGRPKKNSEISVDNL